MGIFSKFAGKKEEPLNIKQLTLDIIDIYKRGLSYVRATATDPDAIFISDDSRDKLEALERFLEKVSDTTSVFAAEKHVNICDALSKWAHRVFYGQYGIAHLDTLETALREASGWSVLIPPRKPKAASADDCYTVSKIPYVVTSSAMAYDALTKIRDAISLIDTAIAEANPPSGVDSLEARLKDIEQEIELLTKQRAEIFERAGNGGISTEIASVKVTSISSRIDNLRAQRDGLGEQLSHFTNGVKLHKDSLYELSKILKDILYCDDPTQLHISASCINFSALRTFVNGGSFIGIESILDIDGLACIAENSAARMIDRKIDDALDFDLKAGISSGSDELDRLFAGESKVKDISLDSLTDLSDI